MFRNFLDFPVAFTLNTFINDRPHLGQVLNRRLTWNRYAGALRPMSCYCGLYIRRYSLILHNYYPLRPLTNKLE